MRGSLAQDGGRRKGNAMELLRPRESMRKPWKRVPGFGLSAGLMALIILVGAFTATGQESAPSTTPRAKSKEKTPSNAGVAAQHGPSPYDVGSKAQLFVDQLLVYRAEHVCFTQHEGKKHPDNPLLVADQPWEGWHVSLYGSVIYDEDEKLFKMWYTANEVSGKYFNGPTVTCYATSTDGIRWKKPLVGTIPSKDGKPHNAVGHFWLASVWKDKDEADPAKRYKMICWQSGGYHTAVSPDGLTWTRLSQKPIAPWNDVITGFWDPRENRYVAFPKNHNMPWRGHKRRLFYTITSEDFVHWTAPVLSWTTDERDDAGSFARLERVRPTLDRPDDPKLMRTEFYGIGVYLAESCTIGFPWMLTVNNDARWSNHEGPMEIQLAVSRDLVHWERPFRTPVIGISGLDEWDFSGFTTSAQAIRVGDEIRLYYSGTNYNHGTPALYRDKFEDGTSTGRGTKYKGNIGLVTWKLDRFVSADAPAEGGVLTTVPVVFEGNRLEINAATGERGEVVVELCDGAGRPLDAFEKSDPFRGDDLRHVVTFGGKKDVSALQGKPVVLRLYMKSAELYSFAFRK